MGSGSRRVASVLTLACAALIAAPSGQAQLFGGDDVARRDIAEQRKQIEALSQRLARLEESLQGMAATNPALEIAQQLEILRQEMRQLRGQIEVLGHETQMAAKRQRDMYVDLDTRLRRLEQPSAVGALPMGATTPGGPAAPSPAGAGGMPPAAASAAPASPPIPTAAASAAPAPAPAPSDAEAKSYEAAQGQRRIGNYQGAITAFEAFIRQYPKSPLAPRAQYWIGDSYYNLRDFKRSIASQQKLIATYPGSSSVPDALLNLASSQIELGDIAGGRRTLDGIVTRYPTSEAAVKAKRRLANLKP